MRQDVLELLRGYDWPGNIREFENAVRTAMINAGDSNTLLTNYFDMVVEEKKKKSLFDVDKLVDEVFEKKWHGEDKWSEFVRTYTSKEWQREILEGCIRRLKKNREKGDLKFRDITGLFGITENNMRQRFHVLGMNWKEIKRS